MFRLILAGLVLLITSLVHADDSAGLDELKDLFFGEALFYAYQEEYFDAISRLDSELAQYYGLDEPELNSLYLHINHAEFSVGDFELYYRMHLRAGRAIRAVLEGNVNDKVKNEAAYRLAKIYHQKSQPQNALHTLQRIKGEIPEKIRDKLNLLRAQVYITNGRFSDAIKLLNQIENQDGVLGYAGYNLAIALIANNEKEAGLRQLDKVGQINSSDRGVQAIRDKANLILGFRLMKSDQPVIAKQYFERVRLKGPFSNRALLGLGWADVAAKKYRQAIIPWTYLVGRNITDSSVQEGMLGLPFAYSKLNLHGKAALLYSKALDSFTREIERLDTSIKSIREGKFLEAVVREEMKKDKNWLINLRDLPETPETYYMMELLASNDFQEQLKNYFDLAELERKIYSWDGYLDAFSEIIKIRESYYTPLLPEVQEQFRTLDSRIKLRTEQREKIASRLDKMLVAPRPDFLATVNERIYLQNINAVEKKHAKQKAYAESDLRYRVERLRGLINWKIDTEYQQRFTDAHNNLAQLDEHMQNLDKTYRSFVRTRQAATQSYRGYDESINQLRIRITMAKEKIKVLMARQGNMLEVMAIAELEKIRQRLEAQQIKARFAMAESYDRAVKAQQENELQQEQLRQQLRQQQQKQEEKPAGQGETESQDKDQQGAADKAVTPADKPAPEKTVEEPQKQENEQ